MAKGEHQTVDNDGESTCTDGLNAIEHALKYIEQQKKVSSTD